ncbi:hypothetical protein C8247_08435 [Paracidovorax avenae]|uniref:hypothetical protein n=1 Tax=Paracidovorax avenae TaxID=80867 RepID=UPI000D1519C7|nr:hypothetical protein [Paracidovorax avenae]AVS70450.1 hypothetical protein C8247_08435 [Paracidovorax avenae]
MSRHIALITQTQALIAAGDIVGAESALSQLADDEGDRALVEVLDELAPKDVLAVMREYDESRASVVNMLVTPQQFARALVLEKQYKDATHTYLRSMVNAVVFRGDVDPVEFLTAIGDLEGGSEALAHYFAEKWSRLEAFARSGLFDATEDYGPALTEDQLFNVAYAPPKVDQDEVADRDWMQLAWLLRYQCPDLFIETLLVLRAKAQAYDEGLGDDETGTDEDDDGKFETSETDRGKATPAARASDEESAI